MPRATASDSDEEVKETATTTERAGQADADEFRAEDNANDGQEGSGEEDEDEEPEYEIEAILEAKQGVFGNGKLGYLVKWKGYDEEENSWVNEEDAGNAHELIDAFWKKQGGRAKALKSAVKPKATPGRKSAAKSEASDDESTTASAASKKRGRGRPRKSVPVEGDERAPKKAKQLNGSASVKTKASSPMDVDEDNEEAPTVEPSQEKKWRDMANWERYIERVDTVERDDDGTLWVYFRLKGKHENCRERTTVCYQRFPKKMFAFYEGNLRWRETKAEAAD